MDSEVLDMLYRKYQARAYAYCIALCGDPELAQDIVADAFVKAYLSLPDVVPSFLYWLLRVCKNLWYDHLRRSRQEADLDSIPWLTDGETPELRFLQNERSRCLWQAMGELPAPDRELVILHYFSGLSLLEIARLTGKSHDAVRQRITRLRHTLKKRLEEQGYGYEL